MDEQVEEVIEEIPYDAFDDLCNRRRGILCPNPHCMDRLFSYDSITTVNCRCGLTYVSGGEKYLKFGVGYPFTMADVTVISERFVPDSEPVQPTEEATEIAKDLGQTIDDSEELTATDVFASEDSESEDLLPEAEPEVNGDVMSAPIPQNEV